MTRISFPKSFVWGTATSSYQIEGATAEGGRGESIWDRFCAREGAIEDGSSGAGACDHYHRYPSDIRLMQELGVAAYRFSIAWPRVVPTGTGAPSSAGLDFYSRLTDALLEAGITPYATLYHWDLPQALEDRGGWPQRGTALAFAEYADVVTRALGDRIKHWITHNEPWCASMLGYQQGIHAPGRRDMGAALRASHHLLLSHGLAVPIIEANSKEAEVGITVNLVPAEPASDSPEDHDACRDFDGYFNRWFLDPLFGRQYPADKLRDYAQRGDVSDNFLEVVLDGDLEHIATPCDFLGINYYNRAILRSNAVAEADNAPRRVFPCDERTDIGWEVHAPSLFEILTRVAFDYRPRKIYITENGAAYSVGPDDGGRIRDDKRTLYLQQHLRAAAQAIEAGVPLAGYFAWSLLDNFEWAEGYTQRFGIVWVDYETQRRTLKDSAHFFRETVSSGGFSV